MCACVRVPLSVRILRIARTRPMQWRRVQDSPARVACGCNAREPGKKTDSRGRVLSVFGGAVACPWSAVTSVPVGSAGGPPATGAASVVLGAAVSTPARSVVVKVAAGIAPAGTVSRIVVLARPSASRPTEKMTEFPLRHSNEREIPRTKEERASAADTRHTAVTTGEVETVSLTLHLRTWPAAALRVYGQPDAPRPRRRQAQDQDQAQRARLSERRRRPLRERGRCTP